MLELLGLGSVTTEKNAADLGKLEAHGVSTTTLDLLVEERDTARRERDFERADEIRDRLAELGWEVRDSAEGAKLVPKG